MYFLQNSNLKKNNLMNYKIFGVYLLYKLNNVGLHSFSDITKATNVLRGIVYNLLMNIESL